MIDKAFQYTCKALNQFVKNEFGIDDTMVIMNNIVDQSCEIPLVNKNKIILSLIDIDQETVKPFYTKKNKQSDGNFVVSSKAERYNLAMLVSTCFDDYGEALKFLNASIQFFKINQSIDANVDSDIPKGLRKIDFEFQKGNDYVQMNNLWSALGAKYQPSVIYKMRLDTYITF